MFFFIVLAEIESLRLNPDSFDDESQEKVFLLLFVFIVYYNYINNVFFLSVGD